MRIKSGYKIRSIAGESVIVAVGTLNVDLTRVISLNPTAVWLWERLSDREFDETTVAALLEENYEVDAATALFDSRAWIDSLRKAGLTDES
jgi:hypothetical protein